MVIILSCEQDRNTADNTIEDNDTITQVHLKITRNSAPFEEYLYNENNHQPFFKLDYDYGTKDSMVYLYEEDILTSIHCYSPGRYEENHFHLTYDTLRNAIIIEPEMHNETPFRLYLNYDHQIEEFEILWHGTEHYSDNPKYTYTYNSSGNVVKSHYDFPVGYQDEWFEYDNKINPLLNFWDGNFIDPKFLSVNNMIYHRYYNVTYESDGMEEPTYEAVVTEWEKRFEYDYNEVGLPITKKEITSDTVYYQYEYSTLQYSMGNQKK